MAPLPRAHGRARAMVKSGARGTATTAMQTSFRQVTSSSPAQERPRAAPCISMADYFMAGRAATMRVTDFSQPVTGRDLAEAGHRRCAIHSRSWRRRSTGSMVCSGGCRTRRTVWEERVDAMLNERRHPALTASTPVILQSTGSGRRSMSAVHVPRSAALCRRCREARCRRHAAGRYTPAAAAMTPPPRHWRSYTDDPLPTPAEALASPFAAFPSWFLRGRGRAGGGTSASRPSACVRGGVRSFIEWTRNGQLAELTSQSEGLLSPNQSRHRGHDRERSISGHGGRWVRLA